MKAMGEWRHSLTLALEMSGQLYAPAAIPAVLNE